MKPAAQVQASIELLDEVIKTAYPADRIMATYFRARRYIGSKDKAAVSEHLYTVLRNRSAYSYLLEKVDIEINARFLVAVMLVEQSFSLSEIFSGQQYCPPSFATQVAEKIQNIDFAVLLSAPLAVQLNVPSWLEPELKSSLGERYEAEMRAANQRAKTDIRVNLLKSTLAATQARMEQAGYQPSATKLSPWGLRFNQRVALFGMDVFKKGWFEVQDQGSQVLAFLAQVKAGQTVVDFCAGAGGKTLALAAMMENKGTLFACDVHSKRLEQLGKRAKRAGVHNVRTHLLSTEHDKWVKKHRATADLVLVDAPCTGTGTWRRSPDSRWNLKPEDLDNLIALQQSILQSASRLVKPGGRLLYATCSLLNQENQQQTERFLENNGEEFEALKFNLSEPLANNKDQIDQQQHHLRMLPALSGTDGFYVGQMKRKDVNR